MVEKIDIRIPPLTGDRERCAYIYLPVGYDGETRYPVLYMFDGCNLFFDETATYGKSWGLADYLDYTETPLIVVGVDCDHEGNGRLSEYSPVDFVFDGEKIRGRGKKFMSWLVKSFKPFIDETYATLQGRRNTAIGGSSMGGLMTLFALAKYGRTFSRGAALSPSLWVSGGEIPPFITGGAFAKDAVLYTDYGSKEFSNHPVQRKVFAQTAAYLIERGVNVTARVVRGGVHSEASWEKQVPLFMHVLGFLPLN